MYKIKYGKSRQKMFFFIFLVFVALISGAAITVGLGYRAYNGVKDENLLLRERIDRLLSEAHGDEKTDSGEREVWIEFVECSDYMLTGDTIDVRVVDIDGNDTKLLASKKMVMADPHGMQLLICESELCELSRIRQKLEEGTVKKIYAVKVP